MLNKNELFKIDRYVEDVIEKISCKKNTVD